MDRKSSSSSRKTRTGEHKKGIKSFPPPGAFSKTALINTKKQYEELYKKSVEQPEIFWAEIAGELEWFKPWHTVKKWNPPEAKWFIGGKTNIAYNCLDRHLKTWKRNKAALIWESEPGETKTYTYQMLHSEVSKFANVLKKLGVKKGDRVLAYMGMVPELAITVLACARIGAVHTVVFGGFSFEALKKRVADAEVKVVVASDVAVKRGVNIPLKPNVDKAAEACPSVESVVVHKRIHDSNIQMTEGRDYWWHELMASAGDNCKAAELDAEHPLFILHTSGTTGKPKGILHTHGGYMVHTYITTKWVFDLKDDDLLWCTADIGWITGHSYVIYGPMLNGGTTFMYEGSPNYPDADRFWSIIDKYKINIFYTTPTAVRAFIKWGDEWVKNHNLSSLRLLGTVGEPIAPETWIWFYKTVGKSKCPIVDTWWQTETGAVLISPLPGVTNMKPGSCGVPLPGAVPSIVDEKGRPVPDGAEGFLVLKDTYPGMFRGLFNNKDLFRSAYWDKFKNIYFSGDGAKKDKDGYYWVTGRIDDVINVTWHRISSVEIESILMQHNEVAEAAVVGRPSEMKGSGIVAFISLKEGGEASLLLKEELKNYVSNAIGVFAKPDEVRFVSNLPRTLSGKLVRRILRDAALNNPVTGDTSTIENFDAVFDLYEQENKLNSDAEENK